MALRKPLLATFCIACLLLVDTNTATTDTTLSLWTEAATTVNNELSQPTQTVAPGALFESRSAAMAAVGTAVDKATSGGVAIHRRADETLRWDQILDHDRRLDQSVSVGTVRDGSLKNAVRLTYNGPHHQIIEHHRRRNTNYGTSELVKALDRAGRYVAEHHGGAPLRIGNLGYPQGGPIPWSGSHQAGRDADIAFYAIDERGDSVPTPDLIEFDDDGEATNHRLFFDVERNWALVRALLSDSDIRVQWLFVSQGLKTLMLEHAIATDEPRRLVERAASVLHQPTNAPPHADHFHLRVGCSKLDRLEGCVDWGPKWPWYDWHAEALFERTHEVLRTFEEGDDKHRRRAMEYLHDIRAPFGPEVALNHGLSDPDPDVRDAAFAVLEELPVDSRFGIELLAEALDQTATLADERIAVLYQALAGATALTAADLAVDHLRDPTRSDDQRRWAAKALMHRMNPELVPELTAAMRGEDNPELRQKLAVMLRRITVQSHELDWTAPLGDKHKAALAEWEQWSLQTDADRRERLLKLISPYGVTKWEELEAVDELIPLLEANDYKRYNVNLILSDWTGRWAAPEWGEDRQAYEFWSNWWDRNRDRLLDATAYPWQ